MSSSRQLQLQAGNDTTSSLNTLTYLQMLGSYVTVVYC